MPGIICERIGPDGEEQRTHVALTDMESGLIVNYGLVEIVSGKCPHCRKRHRSTEVLAEARTLRFVEVDAKLPDDPMRRLDLEEELGITFPVDPTWPLEPCDQAIMAKVTSKTVEAALERILFEGQLDPADEETVDTFAGQLADMYRVVMHLPQTDPAPGPDDEFGAPAA